MSEQLKNHVRKFVQMSDDEWKWDHPVFPVTKSSKKRKPALKSTDLQ
jgi:hypothetical protein